MGEIHNFLGLSVGCIVHDLVGPRAQALLRLRHHLRHQQRVRLRLPARQHEVEPRVLRPARAQLRDRGRGRLDPDRRGAHAAHHLGPVRGQHRALSRGEPGDPAPHGRHQGRRQGRARRRRATTGWTRSTTRPRSPRTACTRSSRCCASRTCTTRRCCRVLHAVNQALIAHTLKKRDVDYVVQRSDKSGKPEVIIVDEFTGRLMPGRRWSDGLHQAVEAKEGIPIQSESQTLRVDHLPELLPHVRQARGHDGHRRHRGARVREDLRPRRDRGADQPPDDPQGPGRRRLQDASARSSTR